MHPVRLKIYRIALMTRQTFLMLQACGAVLIVLLFVGSMTVITPKTPAVKEFATLIPYSDVAVGFLPWIIAITATYEAYQTVKIVRQFRAEEEMWQARVNHDGKSQLVDRERDSDLPPQKLGT